MKTPSESELEQLLHRELRALAPRRAPRTLEHRVLAEIERRSTLAWWHRSYAYWPAWARATFLVAGVGGVGKALLFLWVFWQTGFDRPGFVEAFAPWFSFAERVLAVGAWMVDFCSRLVASIPAWWIYGGLGFVALLYLSCFTLGATAYRVLYRSR